MPEAHTERRAAPRADVDLPLRLSPAAEAQPARLKNISHTGLCCEFNDPVTEMTVMGVDLDLADGNPHRLQGVVVRCDKKRGVNPPTYEVAIYFTEVAAETRQAIQSFVAERVEA